MAAISEDSALISAGILAEFSFFSACIEKSMACLSLLCLWLLLSGLGSAGCFVGAQEHPRETRLLSLLLAVLVVTLNSGYSEHLSSVTFFQKTHLIIFFKSLYFTFKYFSYQLLSNPTKCWALELEAKQLCADRLILPQWGNKMFTFDYVSCLSELL